MWEITRKDVDNLYIFGVLPYVMENTFNYVAHWKIEGEYDIHIDMEENQVFGCWKFSLAEYNKGYIRGYGKCECMVRHKQELALLLASILVKYKLKQL